MTDITNIPLNKLTTWKGNVRKAQNRAALEELAASIKAHGLQQNLVVRKDGKFFAVVAGARRLRALQLLEKAGDIKPAHPVPCRVSGGENELEISLAENVMREQMHPADQFEAYRALADKGMSAADIAVRFGQKDAQISRILRLSRVSPKILKAYRAGNTSLEDVMAFAVTDDHDAQERVLAGLAPWQGAREIRAALTENEVRATDKRVRFVTLKAYEQAGGKLRRDLFVDGDDGVFVLDTDLLADLVTAKLDRAAKRLAGEGWKWVEARPDFDYEERSRFTRIHAEPEPLDAAAQESFDRLRSEHDRLADAWHRSDDDEPPARLVELERAIEEIEDRDREWSAEQLGMAGAVVTIGADGKTAIERGLVRAEDLPKKAASRKAVADSRPGGASALSASLIESLTAHRSAALAATLLDAPRIAVAAVTCSLALEIFGLAEVTALDVTASSQSLHCVEGSKAFTRLEADRQRWSERIPGNAADLWQWCVQQEQSILIDLLTFCAACTVNAVHLKSDREDCPRLVHADGLAGALGLDMRAWFVPTADNYFTRVTKQATLEALREARGTPPAPAWEKLPKADLAALAEREVATTAWLPQPLRPKP